MYKLDNTMLGPKQTSNPAPRDPSIVVFPVHPQPRADLPPRNTTSWVFDTAGVHACPDLLHRTAHLAGIFVWAEAGPREHKGGR